jgi:aryl-alcohol dehydrogenase-like predicted oxidoreductase
MLYGTVDKLCDRISRVVLGCVGFSPDRMEVAGPLLDSFVASGGTTVDTAHVYGDGASERTIGAWLRESGKRQEVIIVTKGAHPNLADWIPRVNPEAIAQDLDESLERLGVETIDLYLLHRDDPSVPVGPLVECLNGHMASGRIRAFGGSNWTHQRIDEANAYASAYGLQGFVASSPHLALAVMDQSAFSFPGIVSVSADPAALAWYGQRQFPLLAWSAQAGGFFSGRKARTHFDTEDNRERLRRVRELAARHGFTPIQMALAWVFHQPLNIFALIGTSKLAHLEESLKALQVGLTPEEVAWLNLET